MNRVLDVLVRLQAPLIEAAARGAVVLVVALVISHLLRRRTAAARHLVWVGAVLMQLALPVFTIWGPRWEMSVPAQLATVMPLEVREQRVTPTTTLDAAARPEIATVRSNSYIATRAAPVTQSEAASPITGRTILLLSWLAGALFVLARLFVGTAIVAMLAKRGARVVDGGWLSLTQTLASSLEIERPLTLLRGNRIGVPITWGIVYPVVLLPEDADAWPEERRRFVLVHEMAHVKRLDALTQLAGQIALALFWFDPLVWIANRRMQLEREHACDDYVLRHGTSPTHYAEELLAMVRSIGTPGNGVVQPAFAALAMARRSEFEGRMLSILDPVLDRHPLGKGRTVMSAFAALLFVIPLAALHPYGQRAAAPLQPKLAATTTNIALPVPDAPRASPVSPSPGAVQTELSSPSAAASTATAMLPAAPAPAKGNVLYHDLCDRLRDSGSVTNQIHSHSDDDDGSSLVEYGSISPGHCARALIVGKVTFSGAEDDITSMPIGTQAVFRERTASSDRQVLFTRGADGAITRSYSENGRIAEYDSAARRWFAEFLPMILAESGVNVGPRVAKWRAEGGVDNVLRHVESMKSSGAKRTVLETLLAGPRLSSDEMEHSIAVAGRALNGSSGDLRAVLSAAAPQARGARFNSSIEEAIDGISSSGDRTAVLMAYGNTDDKEMLIAVARMSKGVTSSGDLARLMLTLQPRYLLPDDRALRSAYFTVLANITSSGDMRRVLTGATSFGALSAATASDIIAASANVTSSGDRAAVLIALAASGAITTRELRGKMTSAAATIPSDGDRARVLQATAATYR